MSINCGNDGAKGLISENESKHTFEASKALYLKKNSKYVLLYRNLKKQLPQNFFVRC